MHKLRLLNAALANYLSIFLLFCFSLPTTYAQYTTASLSGSVLDSSSASIAAAKVKITNTGTSYEQSITTGDDGAFSFARLPIGSYRLTAEKPGFAAYVQEGLLTDLIVHSEEMQIKRFFSRPEGDPS